jgi:hypothetical protein
MKSITPGWRLVFIGLEGEPVSLHGHDPWKHEWNSCSEDAVVVAHPSYPSQRHEMSVYKLAAPGESIRFAAGEFSNGVWGFFVPA